MKQVLLAEKLNLTPRQISRLVRKGMPTHTLKAAQRWRSARLVTSQTKAIRMGGNNGKKGRQNRKPILETKSLQIKNGVPKNIPRKKGLINLNSTDVDTLFLSARALKEKSLAEQASMEVGILMGTLVKREDVERGVFTAARQLRDQLMNLSKRIAPELYELTSVVELEQKLTIEIKNVLESTPIKLMKE